MDNQTSPQEEIRSIPQQIHDLQAAKQYLLDKYGLFGGGAEVTKQHERINAKLEALGVAINS